MAVTLPGVRGLFLNAALLVGGSFVGVGLGEVVLRAYEHMKVRDRVTLERDQVPDPRLVFRLSANAPGHDALGFRNATVQPRVDVVAVGDSMTWGINASREEAWPQVLGRRAARSVYQMAHGGYGPVQYLALAEEASTFEPPPCASSTDARRRQRWRRRRRWR